MNQVFNESENGEYTNQMFEVARQIDRHVSSIISLLEELNDGVIAGVCSEQDNLSEDELYQAVQDMKTGMDGINGLDLFSIVDALGGFHTNESALDEAWGRGRGRGYALLPATMVLYGKRVVTPDEAMSHWGEGTLYICTKMERDGRERTLFVASAGGGVGLNVGDVMDTHHDQTGASKGSYDIKNIVTYEGGERIKTENDFGLNVKGSLSVFK